MTKETLSKKEPLKPLKKVAKKTKKTIKSDSASLKVTIKGASLKALALLAVTFIVQFLPLPSSSINLLTHSTELYSLAFFVLELWNGFINRT
tara:strand:+ start:1535 stop:1810 length:276 start_codon:yes stop_codon:yes gene_type:complete